MQKKRLIVMSTLLMIIVLLGIGTIAYFRRAVNGDITGQTGNLVLIVNEANAVQNGSFSVSLNRSEEEPFVMPGDSGSFNINIDSTGSSTDVIITLTAQRTNLPNNLQFYLDEEHTRKLSVTTFRIEKSDTMTMNIPIYWYWDGTKDNVNDTLFMNASLSANINVSATGLGKSLYETLTLKSSTLDTNVDFSLGASSTNGEGLMMRNGTQSSTYPILYYRGNVTDNNVIYGGYCWLIVRTTETGGTKLIYNGEVKSDGSCTNYSGVGGQTANSTYTGAYINKTTYAFNTLYDSPVYVGYMYNDDNKYFTHSADWDGTSHDDEFGTLDVSGYRAHLLDESRLDNGTGKYNQNKYDSPIKTVIDAWYVSNIEGTEAESLLEDTIWCNDRSITSTIYTPENYHPSYVIFMYSSATRTASEAQYASSGTYTVMPSLTCPRDIDKFTVEKVHGNGDLTYPIGMLTSDEIYLAGNTNYNINNPVQILTYLTIPSRTYWTLSPNGFYVGWSGVYIVGNAGISNSLPNRTDRGIRPAISLNNQTYITSGNGSYSSPYIIS